MNALLLALWCTALPPSFQAETLDGRAIAGPLTALSTDRIEIKTSEGRVSLPVSEVLAVAAREKPKPAARTAGVVVELMDGCVVRGRQFTAAGNHARIELFNEAAVEVPTRLVRTVVFQPRENDPLASDWARLLDMKSDADVLAVRGVGAIDYHAGVIHEVTDAAVRFDLDGEILPVKRTKIFGLIYRHPELLELRPAACRITDSSGSTWLAAALALDGEGAAIPADAKGTVPETTAGAVLRWTTPSGVAVAAPLESLASLDFSFGKQAYVSDLKPESVVWTPYFGASGPLPAAERYFAPRFDRGFAPGAPLRLGGETYRKGVALRCRTELVYRVPDDFREGRFRAAAGIADDAQQRGGRARLVVRGDDRLLFEGVLAGGDPPNMLDLELAGARRLTILVDFAGGLDAGDRLLLGNARFTK